MHNPPLLLLVDDVAENLVLLEAIFAPEGYATRSAENGADALRIARAEAPDLVLLDVLMPGQDGFAVCRSLRADAATRFIPVIMVTALNELEDRIQGLEAGADDFISKPFSDDLLLAKVRSLLRLKQSRDELEALKTDFANMIVHDLRTPTHAILGLAELLSEDSAGGIDARRMLDLIATSARKIDQQITDFSRPAVWKRAASNCRSAPTTSSPWPAASWTRPGPAGGPGRSGWSWKPRPSSSPGWTATGWATCS